MRRSRSIWPRRIAHQSLCSDTGIPHSTHTRVLCLGGSLRPNSRFKNDTPASKSSETVTFTLDDARWFAVGRLPRNTRGRAMSYIGLGVEPAKADLPWIART